MTEHVTQYEETFGPQKVDETVEAHNPAALKAEDAYPNARDVLNWESPTSLQTSYPEGDSPHINRGTE